MKLLKMIFSLMKHRAKKEQYYLEIGAYFLKKGTGYKPGDPFLLPVKRNGLTVKKKVYIANLFYDFGKNKITHHFTTKAPKIEKKR
ncbi:MAG: hypothetical protein PHO74_05015 [Weeksellaceae bacterium]|nr:hypothetical protein [Weeksellaceae bacterium]